MKQFFLDVVSNFLGNAVYAGVIVALPFLIAFFVKRRKPRSSTSHITRNGAASHAGVAGVVKRVRELQNQKEPAIALVGPVYLDVVFWPVDADIFEDRQWANIQSIKLQPGGAVYYVGNYLKQYNRSSTLLTGIGEKEDPSSELLALHISASGWINVESTIQRLSGQSAISFHLVSEDRSRTAIFTRPGAVTDFGWGSIKGQLDNVLGEGGVLFLSGFFKTQLHLELVPLLKAIHKKSLIIADPGSSDKNDRDSDKMKNLQNALSLGLIDIHIASLDEFWRVYGFKNISAPGKLKKFEKALLTLPNELAPVVCLRGPGLPDNKAVIVIVDKKVWSPDTEASSVVGDEVGVRNAFSAALIDALFKVEVSESAKGSIEALVTVAIQGWVAACERGK